LYEQNQYISSLILESLNTMRKFKIGLLLLVILNLPNKASAQVSIGARAGLSLSKLIYSFQGLSINTDRLPEFTGGIPVEIKLSNYFALQPELNFITKGGKSSSSDSFNGYSYSSESHVKINYLELPVFAKFSVGNEKIKLDLFAGPVLGYGLSGSSYSKFVSNGSVSEDSQTLDFENDSISRIDFSINIGAGTSLTVGANRLFFDIHYQAGLSNMDTSQSFNGSSNDSSVKNNNIIFTIGMLTPLTSSKPKTQPVVK
jgi:hypothetical protein